MLTFVLICFLLKILEGGYSLSAPLTPIPKPLSARQTVIAQAKAQAQTQAGSKVDVAPMPLRARNGDQRESPCADSLAAAVDKNTKQTRLRSKKQTEKCDGNQAGTSSMCSIEATGGNLEVESSAATSTNLAASTHGPIALTSVSPSPSPSSSSSTSSSSSSSFSATSIGPGTALKGSYPLSVLDDGLRSDHVTNIPSDLPNLITDANAAFTPAVVSVFCAGDMTSDPNGTPSGLRIFSVPVLSYSYSTNSNLIFAQENGDGGLVKG